MRAIVTLGLLLAAACAPRDESPLGRARQAFGPGTSVSSSDLVCGEGMIFTAVPEPTPPDYDGYSALLVATDGRVLARGREVAYCWESGVRDVTTLARAAAIFLGHSQYLGVESDRKKQYIRDAKLIESPRLEGTTLTFWVVQGSMAPAATKVVVDVASGRRLDPP